MRHGEHAGCNDHLRYRHQVIQRVVRQGGNRQHITTMVELLAENSVAPSADAWAGSRLGRDEANNAVVVVHLERTCANLLQPEGMKPRHGDIGPAAWRKRRAQLDRPVWTFLRPRRQQQQQDRVARNERRRIPTRLKYRAAPRRIRGWKPPEPPPWRRAGPSSQTSLEQSPRC